GGTALSGRTVTWASSNTSMATVSSSGLVKGVAAGTATITATSEGKAGTAAVTVALVPVATVVVSPAPATLPLHGTIQLNVTLKVASQPAGFSYTDPVTGVKVWKVTSSSVPTANPHAGHDYADGPNEVSRGWGAGNNTHTILFYAGIVGVGSPYYLVDFTRGVGFTNYRQLPAGAQPVTDL